MDWDKFWREIDHEVAAQREIDETFARGAERKRTRLWQAEAELARLVDDVVKNRNRPEENA